ncbi:ribosome small subunit-dependent GTPase A [bacterium CG17_big_fil_post_rev_8_21_14_2_50_64_8]|nr:MAG: ribosome small subunit-dependent GTPase A [bacterium CG17_big_fil_post_rev_8_21_14_2_50_64_8]PJA77029.1 MAG: ribosome small subunit-dependent GTPase A [bacterium CG_4_9_14_3_um_filter_65_15]
MAGFRILVVPAVEGDETIDTTENAIHPPNATGVVMRTGGERSIVAHGGRVWSCQLRGKLKQGKRREQTVTVAGDRVVLGALQPEHEPPEAVIEEVLPRRNRISRMGTRRSGGNIEQVLVANLDQVVVVQSLTEPDPQKGFVDRLLVAAERFEVAGHLVLNKVDLVTESALQQDWDYFAGLGYTVLRTSATSGQGVAELAELLRGRTSILMGASGVGKSTLLNTIDPDLALQVSTVASRTGLGRHTTTSTELFPLPQGGFIADSPGLRGFEPWDVDPEEVRDYFPDFTDGAQECRFRTCLHDQEPQCGVKKLVGAGKIPDWRYAAYLALVRDLKDRRRSLRKGGW